MLLLKDALMLPPITTPTTDLAYTFGATPDGQIMVDYVLSADGDLAVVSGVARLAQDVVRWLYTPPGADPYTPAAGNRLYAEVGQPVAADLAHYVQAVDATLSDFAACQQLDLAAGNLAADAVLATWDTPVVVRAGSLLQVSLHLYAASGDATAVAATLPALTSSPGA